MLIKKIPQLKPIILTAEAFKVEDEKNFGDFKVIIWRKEIGDITNTKTEGFIKEAEKSRDQLVACHSINSK